MKAYLVIVTPRAGAEIQAIKEYIARDSPQNAEMMIARIRDALEPLKLFPHRTIVQKQDRRLRYPVRSLSARPYTIYFRVIEDELLGRVLDVRPSARRRPTRFGRRNAPRFPGFGIVLVEATPGPLEISPT